MPNKYGTQKQLADQMGVNKSTVSKWKRAGKLEGLVRKRDGKINLTRALEVLPGRLSPKQQQSINARWGKTNAPGSDGKSSATIPETEPETEADVKAFLDETIGVPANLNIYELQRRNELEKLLMARIKRKRMESDLIHIDTAKKTVEGILGIVISGLESLPPKCAPLVATESDGFECRQILEREINSMRDSVSESIKELPGKLIDG